MIKAVVFAYSEIGYRCLEELIRQKTEICVVITHCDNNDEKIWFRSSAELAEKNNIPVFKTELIDNKELVKIVKQAEPDVIFSFMFRKIISDEILSLASIGAFNLHPSLLPKYRGRCPINWVLVNGESETGLTLHEMVRKADAGNIIAQEKISIGADDDISDLNSKLAEKAPLFLRNILAKIAERNYPLIEQDESKATKYSGRKPDDSRFEWSWSSYRIHNLVRAVSHPYSGAFFLHGNRKLFIWKTKDLKFFKTDCTEAGRIINLKPLTVKAGEGSVEIISIQWENEDELKAEDFIKKYNLSLKNMIFDKGKEVHRGSRPLHTKRR